MKLKSKKLFNLLQKRDEILEEAKAQIAVIEQYKQDFQKIQSRLQKVKEKSIKVVDKLVEGKLGEFEELETVRIIDGEIEAPVVNIIELYKKSYLERKKEAEDKKKGVK